MIELCHLGFSLAEKGFELARPEVTFALSVCLTGEFVENFLRLIIVRVVLDNLNIKLASDELNVSFYGITVLQKHLRQVDIHWPPGKYASSEPAGDLRVWN